MLLKLSLSVQKKVSKKASEEYVSFSLLFMPDQTGCILGQTLPLAMAWNNIIMTGLWEKIICRLAVLQL